MLARNFLFIGLLGCGSAALAVSLLPANRIAEPKTFDRGRRAKINFGEVVDKVNLEFREQWRQAGLPFAPRADDLTISRRLSLGLTGTIPSLEEVRALESKRDEHRVEWWVSRLLEDRRYADYVAERLARAYVGTENGPFLIYRRRRFVLWLSDQLHENVPYDELVRHLISDTGLWTDTPSVNFITVTVDDSEDKQPDPVSLAGKITRAFLGMRIDCLQCHDDQLGNVQLGTAEDPADGLQRDFHQLAAFFSQVSSSGGGIKDTREGAYEYKFLDQEIEELVPHQAPYAQQLVPDKGSHRQQLAEWVTHAENKPFARAIVNRIWALMFGRPLIEPIENIPLYAEFAPKNKYPPGLETLANDFIEHGFDLQRLVRLIAATEVFQRDSRAEFEVTQEHEDRWAVFPLTRLRPEQMAGSLIQSSSLTTIDANANIVFQLQRYFQQNEFIQRYGDTGEDEFADHGGTIPQRLLMMNGALLHQQIRGNPLSTKAAPRIAVLAPDNRKAVEAAYIAVLTRRPSENESRHFANRLEASRGQQRIRQLEDLCWVLLNSTEFSWNH